MRVWVWLAHHPFHHHPFFNAFVQVFCVMGLAKLVEILHTRFYGPGDTG
jgi:hypothetical protein